MVQTIRQTYRHLVQQHLVQREMRSLRQAPATRKTWEVAGVAVLFAAAVDCGVLAQIHLG